jgi:hypothetical protein
MKKLLYFAGVLFSASAMAQENSFLTPMGAYEGIAGNTGIGREGSVGAVIYNPAGLATLQTTKISASGSAFSRNNISLKSDYINEEVEYIQTTPTQITTLFNTKYFNWAFSVIVPKSNELEYAIENGTPGIDKVNEDGYQKLQETLFGPSIGFKLSEKFKIGLSYFISKRDEKERYVEYQDFSQSSEQTFYQMDTSALAAYPVLGLLFTPTEEFALGLNFSGPSTQLGGEANSRVRYVSWDTTGGGLCPNGIPDGTCSLAWYSKDKTENINYERPLELGIGFSWNITKQLKILTDVTSQFAKEYEIHKSDALEESSSISFVNSTRYNVGFEYLTSQTDAVTLGFMYNPSPTEDSDLNFVGGTVGYRSIDDIADSSVGLFYNQAKDETGGVETTYSMYGLFLSTSINFTK